jgi:hypothetical protein
MPSDDVWRTLAPLLPLLIIAVLTLLGLGLFAVTSLMKKRKDE